MANENQFLETIIKKYNNLENNNFVISKKDELKDFTGNENLTTENLLQASAKGTEENYHLDPIPQLNKLGQIYSTLIKNISATASARTDAIKMNRKNMDYTNNGEYSEGKIYDLDFARAFDINGDGVIGIDDTQLILKISAEIGSGNEENIFGGVFESCTASEAKNLDKSVTDLGDLSNNNVGTYENRNFAIDENENCYFYKHTYDLHDWYLFLYDIDYKEGEEVSAWKETLLNKISLIKENLEVDANLTNMFLKMIDKFGEGNSYISLEQFAEYLGAYKVDYYLNLLMPQYKRRVEVEDLNENFWVIGQVLDAIVGTLYCPNCLLDTIIKLVASNDLIQDVLSSIIDYLEEINNQITIIQKVAGIGDVRSINWSYKDVVNPKISFYENVNMANFKIILQNDYGKREIGFPIANLDHRNGLSYEGFTGETDGKKFLNVFFAEGDSEVAGRNERNHLSVLKCFDQISLLKKYSLPMECFLWRRVIEDTDNVLSSPRCMASFSNIPEKTDIDNSDAATKKRWGYQPYCNSYYDKDTEITYDNLLNINEDRAYYYGLPQRFDIVMYDVNYYYYRPFEENPRKGLLTLRDMNNESVCLQNINKYYKENSTVPVIFMPSKELYNGEIIAINFDNVCIQDMVPQNDESLESAYWTINNRNFYRSTRARATDTENTYNAINLVYANKEIDFVDFNNSDIRKRSFINVGVISSSEFSIDSPSQYIEMSNLEYHHYYNVARNAMKITCYSYPGFSDSEGVFANTASGLLQSVSAYGFADLNYYQPKDGYESTKNSYIDTYKDIFDSEKPSYYDIFEMFKIAIKDLKGKGEKITSNADKKNYYPFAPVAFKVRNFPFSRKIYLNSAKLTKEFTQKDWEIGAPTDMGIYTIDPLNTENCAYNTGKRADTSKPEEIAYNFINSNAPDTAASIPFDDTLFLFNVNWVENLNGETFENPNGIRIYPRLVNFNLFGRSCSGAPGETVAHKVN